MIDNQALNRINLIFPDISVESLSRVGEGLDNVVYLVNSNIVVRLAKQSSVRLCSVQPEIDFLNFVENRLSVKTPSVIHAGSDGFSYSYQFISGDKIAVSDLENSKKTVEFIELWINISLELENLTEEVANGNLPVENFKNNEYRLSRAHEVVNLDILSPEQTKIVRDSTSSYLLNWNSAKLVLVHGDLGAGNWLFDKIQHTYAVIDWSDSCFAPQEFQMYRLITDYPEKINEIIQLFEGRSGRRINRDLIFDCGVLSICSRIAECMERAPLTVDIKIQELEAWSNLSL